MLPHGAGEPPLRRRCGLPRFGNPAPRFLPLRQTFAQQWHRTQSIHRVEPPEQDNVGLHARLILKAAGETGLVA
jgi:hypothetical protein